jgi:hypothetical protein
MSRSAQSSKFKLVVRFKSPSKAADGKARVFYSFDKKDDESYGFSRLIKLAESIREKGELEIAEVYVNNPYDPAKEVRLVRIYADGRKI